MTLKNIINISKLKILVFIYLFVIHVFIILYFYNNDFLNDLIFEGDIYSEAEILNSECYKTQLTFSKRVDENINSDVVVFIGDSLIKGVAVTTVHNNSVNFGIGNDTTVGVLKRVSQYASIKKSKLVVISVGLNDLEFRDDFEILENYKKIIQLIPDNVKVIINSILPINSVVLNKPNYKNRLIALNMGLKKISESSRRLYFLNITSDLTNFEGDLSDEYHVGDGVHLNARGNNIWISKLQEKLSKIILI